MVSISFGFNPELRLQTSNPHTLGLKFTHTAEMPETFMEGSIFTSAFETFR